MINISQIEYNFFGKQNKPLLSESVGTNQIFIFYAFSMVINRYQSEFVVASFYQEGVFAQMEQEPELFLIILSSQISGYFAQSDSFDI